MPVTTWIRDLLGIRKDFVDTERSVLEVERLEAEKRARNLITPATLDDVKEYDPKYKQIRRGFAGFEAIYLMVMALFWIGLLILVIYLYRRC